MNLLRCWRVLAFGLMSSAVAYAANPAPPAPTPPKPGMACVAGHFRNFDFWVGDWDVYDPKGKLVGSSQISRILGDCVIAEQWRGGGGVEGRSHNMYDASHGRWTQFWVDNGGNTLLLHGGLKGSAMVLVGEQPDPKTGKVSTQRITWWPLANHIVRQLWESSSDAGKTWIVAFDGRYQKAGSPPPPLHEDVAKP